MDPFIESIEPAKGVSSVYMTCMTVPSALILESLTQGTVRDPGVLSVGGGGHGYLTSYVMQFTGYTTVGKFLSHFQWESHLPILKQRYF